MSGIPDANGQAAFDREGHLAELGALEADLAAIEVALRRLDDGSYGTCEVCRGPLADDPLLRRCETHAGGPSPDTLRAAASQTAASQTAASQTAPTRPPS